MLNPSAERELTENYRLSTEKARQWWNNQAFESRKNIVIESDAVINDDQEVEDQIVADVADSEYDELPDETKQEIDSQIDEEEDIEEIFEVQGEEYLQCSKCDDLFTSNEDYDVHKSVDHGEEPEDFEDSEETYKLTMNPDLTREALREANSLLTETEEKELYGGYDKTGKIQSSVMPYNVPAKATGKYNDNPNEFFYSNKIFRAGDSALRTASLGEAETNEDWEDEESERVQKALDKMNADAYMKQLTKKGYNEESKASEGDSEWYSDWNKAVQDLKNNNIQSYEEHARKYGFDAWDQNPSHNIEQAIKNMEWTIDYEKSVESKASEFQVMCPKCHNTYDTFAKGGKCEYCGADNREFYGMESKSSEDDYEERAEWNWLTNKDSAPEVDYDQVEYEDDGVSDISVPNAEPKGEDKNEFLDDVDIKLDEVNFVYPTKSNESTKSYIKESEPFDEEYEEFEDSDDEIIEETITVRKLTGYSDNSIAQELHINYGVSHEEALEKVYSVEVSTNDKVAQTFFGKMFKECTESEKDELRMYSGSD